MSRKQLLSGLLVSLLIVSAIAPVGVALSPSQETGTLTTVGNNAPTSNVTNETTSPTNVSKNTSGSDGVEFELPKTNNGSPKVASGILQDSTDDKSLTTSSFTHSTTSGDQIKLVVRAKSGQANEAIALAERLGNVQTQNGDRFVTILPQDAVSNLAQSEHVGFVRRPYPSKTFGHITSDGVDEMNATRPQELGYDGENVTVAVVDFGFNATNREIADNVVATRNFSAQANAFNQTGTHGTACVELVVDTAPNVSIVLVAVGRSGVSMQNALDYLAKNDSIDAVSMSVGAPAGAPLDGSAAVSQDIDDVVASGKPFFMSAGNAANGAHWNGTWQDGNKNGWLNFTPNDELMNVGTGPVSIIYQWRDWPTSDQDYDLALVNNTGSIVATSMTSQTGSQPPVERLTYYGDRGENYYLAVRKVSADGTAEFNAYVISGPFEHAKKAQSLVVPATSKQVTAVAAMNAYTGKIEPFSSRGPTVDGRIKPTLTAPDNVTTSVYQTRSFYGTSAAAPHAAGAAALLLDVNPRLSADEVTTQLQQTARHLRETQPNPVSGYGLIDANRSITSLAYTTVDACRPIDNSGTFALEHNFTTTSNSCLTISASDVTVKGNHQSIAGDGATTGLAITAPHPVTNVTIQNIHIRNVTTGLTLGKNVSSATLRNVTITDTTTGISTSAAGLTVQNLTVDNTDRGVVLASANRTTVSNAIFRNTTRALSVTNGAHDNTFRDITALDVSGWAYHAEGSAGVNYVDNLTISEEGTLSFTGADIAVDDGPTLTESETPNNRDVVAPTLNITNTSDNGWVALNTTYNQSDVSDKQLLTLWHRDDSGWSPITSLTHNSTVSPPRVSANITSFSTFALLAYPKPVAAVTPSAVEYDEVLVNHTGSRNVTISNTGTVPLNVTNISITGPQAAAYTYSVATEPFTLSPGEDQEINVTVAADTLGWANATLRIAHNDTVRNVTTVPLTASIVDEPRAAAESNSVAFSDVHVGNASTRNVTITNTGTDPLAVTDVQVSGPDAGQYRLPDGSVAPIDPGKQRNVSVTFAPTTTGATSATLSVTHNGSANATTVSLSGSGVAPRIEVTPSAVTESGIAKGATKTYTITVANTGNTPLRIESVDFATNASAFSLSATSPFTIEAGSQREVTVTFHASETGSHSAAVLIRHNGSASESPVAVNYSLSVQAATSGGSGGSTGGSPGGSGGTAPVNPGGTGGTSPISQPTTTPTTTTQPSTNESVVNVDTSGPHTLVTVSQVGTNATVVVELPPTSAVVSLDALTLNVDGVDAFSLTIKSTTKSPTTIPSIEESTEAQAIQYLNLSHPTMTTSEIDEATLTVQVSRDRLAELNATAENVTLYRYSDGWTPLNTSVTKRTDTAYILSAESSGLSAFAIGVENHSVSSQQTPNTTTTTQQKSSTTSTNTTSGDSPGFGVGAVALALLVATLLGRRW